MSTIFIDCKPGEQATEIREFLKSLGAEIEVTDVSTNVNDIVNNCQLVWKQDNLTEIESVLNSVVSLLLALPEEMLKPKINEFCDVVVRDATEAKKLNLSLKILVGVLHHLSEHSALRYPVYMAMLTCAKRTAVGSTGQNQLLQMVETDLVTLKVWRDFWKLTDDQWQNLLRSLHETQVKCNEGELAARTMFELLSSYSDEKKAKEAREDSIRCVASALNNPDVYLFDHLISLKPVERLKGSKMYELLHIFVHGDLADYQKFAKDNHKFLTQENQFDTEDLLRKMRLLTLATIALDNKSLLFSVLCEKLQLKPEEIESFVIEAIRSKIVKAKIDQVGNKVVISSVTHRTFSKHEWKSLHNVLLQWRSNIETVGKQISTISKDLNNPTPSSANNNSNNNSSKQSQKQTTASSTVAAAAQ